MIHSIFTKDIQFGGYAPTLTLERPALQLPPLVQPEVPVGVPASTVDRSQARFGVLNSASMRDFVSRHPNIHRVIGTGGTVLFGEIEIGPAGGISNGNHKG